MIRAATSGRDSGHLAASAELTQGFRASGWWGDHCLLDWWRMATLASPDALAVVDRGGSAFTYAQLDDQSSRLAGWLRDKGVGPGDVVGVQLPNWAEFMVAFVATTKVGATINPLSANLRRSELIHAIGTCATKVLLMPTFCRSTDYRPLAAELLAAGVGLEEVLHVRDHGGLPGSASPYLEVLTTTAPLPAADWVRRGGDDVAAILFTSGSEADPKGVMLSNNNLIASETAFAYALRLGVDDRMFMPAPLGHATGFMHGVIMPILTRGTSILSDSTEGPVMADLIRRHGATCGMAVPTVIDSLLCVCECLGGGLETVRFLCCGGAPVPRRLLERARDLGVRLYSVYGSTESAPHTMTTFHDSDERVLSTDGRACPGTEVRIVDPVTRQPLPPGAEGEECSRGPAVFCGYAGQAKLTSEVRDSGGWYYSGDLAVMDADGYIRITGRCKDVIERGGENISAAEVERALLCHPSIRAAAVVPMPDDVLGERACAFLVSRDGSHLDVQALRDYFVSAGIAKFKIPERVEYLDAMPLTGSGKVAKAVLRQRAAHLRVDGGSTPSAGEDHHCAVSSRSRS